MKQYQILLYFLISFLVLSCQNSDSAGTQTIEYTQSSDDALMYESEAQSKGKSRNDSGGDLMTYSKMIKTVMSRFRVEGLRSFLKLRIAINSPKKSLKNGF